MKISTFFAAATVAAFGLTSTSCGGGEKGNGNDTATYTELSDSISRIYGTMTGMFVGSELKAYARDEGKPYDTDEFIAGVESVIGQRHSEAYLAGVATGLRMSHDLAEVERMGLNVRRDVVLDDFRKTVALDTVTVEETNEVQDRFEAITNDLRTKYMEAEDARMAQTDEAIQNIKTGEALVNKMKAAEPKAKTTDSGLTYVIWTSTDSPKISATDRVIAKYTGSHLDGKVFDSNDNAMLVPETTVPGFREGLLMLGKGDKATFWVPGKLAYKGNGVPQAGIGPMETLVFDVEIIDVNPPVENL